MNGGDVVTSIQMGVVQWDSVEASSNAFAMVSI
jgi:hypothetical protein